MKTAEYSQKIFLKGKGSYIKDVEGHDYTDYYLHNGSLILGHAPRNVVLAAKKYAERGIGLGVRTKAQQDLENYLVQALKLCDEVCLLPSEHEAMMCSIHQACQWTQRKTVIVFEGYESAHQGLYSEILVLPLNDAQAFEQTVLSQKDVIAAVVLDVLSGLEVDSEFVKIVREVTQAHGIVLICDERIGGFRSGEGLAHKSFGIEADMICLGGILGAGFPLGAVGGKAEIMQGCKGSVISSAVARSSLMTLRLCDKKFYQRFDRQCEQFALTVNDFLKTHNLSVELLYFHSMMRLRPNQERMCDGLADYCLRHGIYISKDSTQMFFISSAHTVKDLDKLYCCLKSFFLNREEDDL